MWYTFGTAKFTVNTFKDMTQNEIKELSWDSRSTIMKILDFLEEGNLHGKLYASPINDGCIQMQWSEKLEGSNSTFSVVKLMDDSPEDSHWLVEIFINTVKGFFNLLGRPSSEMLYNRIQNYK